MPRINFVTRSKVNYNAVVYRRDLPPPDRLTAPRLLKLAACRPLWAPENTFPDRDEDDALPLVPVHVLDL